MWITRRKAAAGLTTMLSRARSQPIARELEMRSSRPCYHRFVKVPNTSDSRGHDRTAERAAAAADARHHRGVVALSRLPLASTR